MNAKKKKKNKLTIENKKRNKIQSTYAKTWRKMKKGKDKGNKR